MPNIEENIIPPQIIKRINENFEGIFHWRSNAIMQDEIKGIALANGFYPLSTSLSQVKIHDVIEWHKKKLYDSLSTI